MKLRSTWNIQIFGNRFPSELLFYIIFVVSLATRLQFFFLRGAKNSACKLQFFLQERIADFLAEGAIVFAREIARSCKKRSYSFCNVISQRLQVMYSRAFRLRFLEVKIE